MPEKSPAAPSAASTLALGVWGGSEARAKVDEKQVRVMYTCASGSFAAPVKLDASGRFEVEGRYVAESGAPPPTPPTAEKVLYRGEVKGTKLSLSVRYGGEWQPAHELTHGEDVVVQKCMSARPLPGLE